MRLFKDTFNKDEIYKAFGIHRSEASLQKIIQEGTIVEGDIRKHIELNAQLIQEEKDILNDLPLPARNIKFKNLFPSQIEYIL